MDMTFVIELSYRCLRVRKALTVGRIAVARSGGGAMQIDTAAWLHKLQPSS